MPKTLWLFVCLGVCASAQPPLGMLQGHGTDSPSAPGGEAAVRHAQTWLNGQHPEGNNYLVDVGRKVDNDNGGYGMQVSVDATSEFHILTLNAPARIWRNQRLPLQQLNAATQGK